MLFVHNALITINYRNYLGLALLDANLSVIPETDVVLDINKDFFVERPDRKDFEDCQLIAAATKHGASFHEKGQLHLLCNEHLLPITLRRVRKGGDNNHHDPDAVAVMC